MAQRAIDNNRERMLNFNPVGSSIGGEGNFQLIIRCSTLMKGTGSY